MNPLSPISVVSVACYMRRTFHKLEGTMKAFFKIVLSFLFSILCAVAAVEIYIRTYVYETATIRADHSDDYGMAFNGLLLGLVVFFVTAVLCVIFFSKKPNPPKKD